MRPPNLAMAAVAILLSQMPFPAQTQDKLNGDEPRTSHHFEHGAAHHDAGEFTQASAAYQRAIRQNPNLPKAWYNLALVHYHLNNLLAAERYLDTLLRHDPLDAGAHGLLGLVLYQRKQADRAVAAFNYAISINPSNDLYIARGLAYLAGGHFHRASLDFDAVLGKDPGHVRACHGKAAALLLAGNLHLAISYCNRILDLQPDHAAAYANRAIARHRQGDPIRAAEDFRKALELGQSAEIYLARGCCLLENGDLHGAFLDAKMALRNDPLSAKAHFLIGETEMGQGAYAEASKSLETAIKLDSSCAECHLLRARALVLSGQFDTGIEEVGNAEELGISAKEGKETLLWIYQRMDQARLARQGKN